MRRLYGVILLALAVISVDAQPRLRNPEMYVGAHGGAIFSMALFTPEVAGSTDILDRTLVNGLGGAVFRYSGHKCCALQVELNYYQRGWCEKIDNVEGVKVDYQRRVNYLELPVLSHFYFGKRMVRGFINIGPRIGYCVKDFWTGTKHPTQQAQYVPLDNKFDWGVAAGVGMQLRTVKSGSFQWEVRFNYSCGEYFNNKTLDYFSHSNPISLCVNLGYLWELKPKKSSSDPISGALK